MCCGGRKNRTDPKGLGRFGWSIENGLKYWVSSISERILDEKKPAVVKDWKQLAKKAPFGQARGGKTGAKKSSVADLSETSQVKLLQACLSAASSEIDSLETLYLSEVEAHRRTKEAHDGRSRHTGGRRRRTAGDRGA